MEITKNTPHGLIIKGNQVALALNPQNPQGQISISDKVNFVLSSQSFLTSPNLDQDTKMLSWPGEYEISGTPIKAFFTEQTEHNTENRPLIFIFQVDGINIAYLPQLPAALPAEKIEAIGNIDLLIFETTTEDKALQTTIEEIDPNSILPLFQDTQSSQDFWKLHSLNQPDPQAKITIKSRSDLNTDQMLAFQIS